MMASTTQRRLSQFALLLHARKTVGLAAAVLRDVRIHWFHKALYLVAVCSLLLAVLFPEALGDLLTFIGIPGLGGVLDLLGLPVDATIDWVAFAVATYNLLRIFPSEIVGEHYDRLFRPRRAA